MSNEYYLGNTPTSIDDDSPEEQTRLVHRLRQYLQLRNLTVLLGNGCSIPLGAPLIGNTANIRNELDQPPYRLTDDREHERATTLLDRLLAANTIGIEPLLTVLTNIQANEELLTTTTQIGKHMLTTEDATSLERLIKKWVYEKCRNLHHAPLPHHKELLRRLLLRSTNLPRTKIFTTNYDLIIERALDELGIMYFDGFIGTITRTMRTESYHYDLYYPGDTTEGRVSRVDRVIHLYKMHGSINWRREHHDITDVSISHTIDETEYGNLMIYPSPLKATEMNGYPYAEMFRHFTNNLHQPQSALLTIGYSFQDDHINRLIYQALNIPSFTLIIVIPTIEQPDDEQHLEPKHEIWRLINHIKSKRVIVITGATTGTDGKYTAGAGTLQEFSTKWLPDITELNVDEQARKETIDALKPLKTKDHTDAE